MKLTTREVEKWLNPWPIAFKNRRRTWSLSVVPLSACGKLYSLWETDGVGQGGRAPKKRRTIEWWAQQASKGKMQGNQHYVHMLARFQVPVMSSLTVMTVTYKGKSVVVDGNHHLIATLLVSRFGYEGYATELTHAGVLKGR